jgi:hypothetical protein
VVLPHLETLVQNCGRREQNTEHVTEDAYSCVHHQETHKVAGKLPIFQMGREKMEYDHRRIKHADGNGAVNASPLHI